MRPDWITLDKQKEIVLLLCNYEFLWDKFIKELEKDKINIFIISLNSSNTNCHKAIKEQLESSQSLLPDILLVSGLEKLSHPDILMQSLNSDRPLIQQLNFSSYLLFRVTEQLNNQLKIQAPDFYQVTKRHDYTPTKQELKKFMKERIKQAYNRDTEIIIVNVTQITENEIQNNQELNSVKKDLEHDKKSLDNAEKAGWEFALGQTFSILSEDYRQHIVNSINFLTNIRSNNNQERKGYALYSLGMWWMKYALNKCFKDTNGLENAKEYLENCIKIFKVIDECNSNSALTVRFIDAYGEVVRRLCELNKVNFDTLEQIGHEMKTLHQKNQHQYRFSMLGLARAYGFLASVYLHKKDWSDAQQDAQQALTHLDTWWNDQDKDKVSRNPGLKLEYNFHKGLYNLLLARAMQELENSTEALSKLETAHEITPSHCDPQLFISILKELHSSYTKKGEYLKAFEKKLEREKIERQYGSRAFIGIGQLSVLQQNACVGESIILPPEICATGRDCAVKFLREALKDPYHRLIVVYGPSGAGKSSLLQAGLIPEIKHNPIQRQTDFLIYISEYTLGWEKNFVEEIVNKWQSLDIKLSSSNLNDLNQEIRDKKIKYRPLTIMILDQFEDFFIHLEKNDREYFYSCLVNILDPDCLNTKIIFSLREDYLYHLLECSRLISNRELIGKPAKDGLTDILNNKRLKYIGNFSSKDASLLIEELSKSLHDPIPKDLIEELVRDLSQEVEGIRPIELQIIGSQLETQGIKDLNSYKKYGRKNLRKRFLEDVIHDCGKNNEFFGELVLISLTGEDNIRPFKTFREIKENVIALIEEFEKQANDNSQQVIKINTKFSEEKLRLIINILSVSRLVNIKNGDNNINSINRDNNIFYQLSHDYLNGLIRELQGLNLIDLVIKQKQREKLKNILDGSLVTQAKEADLKQQQAQIEVINAFNTLSETRLRMHDGLMALVASLKAAKKLKENLREFGHVDSAVGVPLELRTVDCLRNIVYTIQERNRLEKHEDQVTDVNCNLKNRLIASASRDKTVMIFSIEGELKHTLRKHQDVVTCVRFSPDGLRIATASADKTVRIWDLNGRELKKLENHQATITFISFHPHKKILASIDENQKIKFWNFERGGEWQCLTESIPQNGTHICFSSDGRKFVCVNNKEIKLWNIEIIDEQSLRFNVLENANPSNINSEVTDLCFSNDGDKLAWVENTTFRVWDIKTGQDKLCKEYDTKITSLSFSLDNQKIAIGSMDRTISIWDLTGKCLATLRGHHAEVTAVCFYQDDQGKVMLASGSKDKTVRLWSQDTTKLDFLEGHDSAVTEVSFSISKGDRRIATASYDGNVKLWDYATGTLIKTLNNGGQQLTTISFDRKKIVIGTSDGKICLWRSQDDQENYKSAELTGHEGCVKNVKLCFGGQYIVSVGEDSKIILRDREGQEVTDRSVGSGHVINMLSYSDKSQMIATGSSNRTVNLWRVNNQGLTEIKTSPHLQDSVTNVIFKPSQNNDIDDEILVIAGKSFVKLWDCNNKLSELIKSRDYQINSISFRHDGLILASGNSDNTVKLWNLKGQELCILRGHQQEVYSVQFSPDGKKLASSDGNGQVILWNLDLDDLLRRGAMWVRDYLKYNSSVEDSDRSLSEEVLELVQPETSYDLYGGPTSNPQESGNTF